MPLRSLAKHDIIRLTELIRTRLRRMQSSPGLLSGFLAGTLWGAAHPCYPTTSEAWSGPGGMTVTASREAPGCQDASCVLVVKMNSATRLSLSAGHPKPTRASLLTKGSGTAVRRPLVTDAT